MTDPGPLPEGAEVRSAIVWLGPLEPDHPSYELALGAGGFRVTDCLGVWPAVFELGRLEGRRPPKYSGLRLGLDVHRRCFVVEVSDGVRVLINLDATQAALALGRLAMGEGAAGG